MDDLATIKQRIEMAHTEVCEIAEQGASRRWRMHIPAQPDRDSDLLISRALKDAEDLAAEVERLRLAVDPAKVGLVEKLVRSSTRLVQIERDAARAEVERLREQLHLANVDATNTTAELTEAEAGKPVYELPVTDQSVIDSASPEVSRIANCVGYALAERGVKFTADDTFAAAHSLVNQGLAAADDHPTEESTDGA